MIPAIRTLIDIIRMGRFHFLFGGFLLYSMGALFAMSMEGKADLVRFVLGYLVFAPAHLSVSYSNECFDLEADSHNSPTLFSGGSGVLGRRPGLREAARWIAIALIAASVVLSFLFMAIYRFTLLFPAYVMLGGLLGWFYSAPPVSLSYRGLGEISTSVTIGVLVPFMGFYVMSGGFDPVFLLLVPGALLYGVLFILSVEIPDMEADLKGGKRTLLTRIGRQSAFMVTLACALGACGYFSFLWILGSGPLVTSSGALALASLAPLGITMLHLFSSSKTKRALDPFAISNMMSLFGFLIVTDLALISML